MFVQDLTSAVVDSKLTVIGPVDDIHPLSHLQLAINDKVDFVGTFALFVEELAPLQRALNEALDKVLDRVARKLVEKLD